jgi:hypothetical protein
MIVSIHQPNHLPYLGFFDKMAHSDVFILYDSTQYKTDDWQNRNKIRTKEGWMWLTIPIKHNFGDVIKDVKIDNSKNWQKKHWNSIVANYAKAPYFKQYKPVFEEFYTKKWENLSEFNNALIIKISELLGLKTKIILASELMKLESKGPRALLDMCKKLGATVYLSGADGDKYITDEMKKSFDKSGVKLEFQEYVHPEYKQTHPNFEKYMCILDLLFNHGSDSLNILKNK